MPQFISTHNILHKNTKNEVFDPNWFDSIVSVYPDRKQWDYSRELKIEEVDIWEIIYENSDGRGLYAAWLPSAEFYLLTLPMTVDSAYRFETFYGAMSGDRVFARCMELGITLHKNIIWVEPEDMWLYQEPELTDSKIIIL